MPRLRLFGGASCPSLLLEPQYGQILLPYSEYSDDFGQLTNVTINSDSELSPEGLQICNYYCNRCCWQQQKEFVPKFLSYASGLDYTASCFVKANGYNYCRYTICFILAELLVVQRFCSIYQRGKSQQNSDNLDATIEAVGYGNGWYRCIANFDATNQAFGSTIS